MSQPIKPRSNSTIPEYHAQAIEEKWQRVWEEEGVYRTSENKDLPKKYVLEMFPYPSGDLHMGHARNYSIGDAMARQARMRGFDVLHPMGFDAFGLPAENAAIKNKTQAAQWTYANMDNALATMRRMGFSYDYDRLVKTCDPDYYKWGQWTFIKMWERGLAYRDTSPVNWCPSCNTVLANEQVVEGACWRCGSVPEKRELSQWYLRITDYAQELLDDLDTLDGWPERVKQMQRNWIGRSEGAEVDFVLVGSDGTPTDRVITVFTTRPDTLFGVSFFVLPPESPLARELMEGSEHEEEFLQLKKEVEQVSSVDRQGSKRAKHGVCTGRYVINPMTGKTVPIWIADYVLMDYGTGAVMGVPSGDQRDFDFARTYDLDIPPIILSEDDPLYEQLADRQDMTVTNVDWDKAMEAEGRLVQSGEFTGMLGGHDSPAVKAITAWLEEHKLGRKTVNYRLRDWLISRQRYWGNPIPMIHCDHCGIVPVPYEDLPVLLPQHLDLGAGETLRQDPSFYETSCPVCGKPARRETDTMDTFTCSSWYYLRYCDPHNDELPFSYEAAQRWMAVDNYIGGIEHAILHLLYSRFWTKVLRDSNMLSIDEPFKNLLCQGMVKDEHGDVMSKSQGNVVAPSSVIEPYGADTMRLTILFIAPPEKDFDWDPHAVAGCSRFLKRAWSCVFQLADAGATRSGSIDGSTLSAADRELNRTLHRMGMKCTADFDRQQFNTAISAVMELTNAARHYLSSVEPDNYHADLCWRVAHDIVAMMAPICPHWAEELYHEALRCEGYIYNEPWPRFDEAQAQSEMIEMAVQVKGRVRARIHVAADASQAGIEELAQRAVEQYVNGKTIVKTIVVPGRLVNIVVR